MNLLIIILFFINVILDIITTVMIIINPVLYETNPNIDYLFDTFSLIEAIIYFTIIKLIGFNLIIFLMKIQNKICNNTGYIIYTVVFILSIYVISNNLLLIL